MDQRAFYLAQKSYQRAVAEAHAADNAARARRGLPPSPSAAEVAAAAAAAAAGGAVAGGAASSPKTTTVLSIRPIGRDHLGASDDVLEAAVSGVALPALDSRGAVRTGEVDVRLVRETSEVGLPGDGLKRTPASSPTATIATVQIVHSTREQLARAGFAPSLDDDEDDDALFDEQESHEAAPRRIVTRSSSSMQLSIGRTPPPTSASASAAQQHPAARAHAASMAVAGGVQMARVGSRSSLSSSSSSDGLSSQRQLQLARSARQSLERARVPWDARLPAPSTYVSTTPLPPASDDPHRYHDIFATAGSADAAYIDSDPYPDSESHYESDA